MRPTPFHVLELPLKRPIAWLGVCCFSSRVNTHIKQDVDNGQDRGNVLNLFPKPSNKSQLFRVVRHLAIGLLQEPLKHVLFIFSGFFSLAVAVYISGLYESGSHALPVLVGAYTKTRGTP